MFSQCGSILEIYYRRGKFPPVIQVNNFSLVITKVFHKKNVIEKGGNFCMNLLMKI